MKVNLTYICRYCGQEHHITSFWKWFWTPHLGSKKWIKCNHCGAKRHYMVRKDWKGPRWLDWYK